MDPSATSPRLRSVAYSRALRFGLAASILAHAFGLALYPRLDGRRVRASPPLPYVPSVAAPPVTVIEVVTVAPPQSPQAPIRTQGPAPSDPPSVPTEAPTPGAAVTAGTPGGSMGPGLPTIGTEAAAGAASAGATAAERLRPSMREAILWAPVDPALTEPSLEQRLQLELAGRLAESGDSLAAVAAAETAATDWTYTDAEGKRWGVSPGQIHLGGITIPLPFAFGINPDNQAAVNRRLWEWNEMQRQSGSAAVRESWRERADAIRERRDRERDLARPDTSGTPR